MSSLRLSCTAHALGGAYTRIQLAYEIAPGSTTTFIVSLVLFELTCSSHFCPSEAKIPGSNLLRHKPCRPVHLPRVVQTQPRHLIPQKERAITQTQHTNHTGRRRRLRQLVLGLLEALLQLPSCARGIWFNRRHGICGLCHLTCS